jgi:Ca2+-binding EF-hand superfamily protein
VVEGAASVTLPTFEECLRLYYPHDSKETITTLTKWVTARVAAKIAASQEKMRVNDEALVKALDRDGDGTISIGEFCELGKITGLSKVQMRARFRDKDFGNSGQLNMQQMRELLQDLREEYHARARRVRTSPQPHAHPPVRTSVHAHRVAALTSWVQEAEASEIAAAAHAAVDAMDEEQRKAKNPNGFQIQKTAAAGGRRKSVFVQAVV